MKKILILTAIILVLCSGCAKKDEVVVKIGEYICTEEEAQRVLDGLDETYKSVGYPYIMTNTEVLYGSIDDFSLSITRNGTEETYIGTFELGKLGRKLYDPFYGIFDVVRDIIYKEYGSSCLLFYGSDDSLYRIGKELYSWFYLGIDAYLEDVDFITYHVGKDVPVNEVYKALYGNDIEDTRTVEEVYMEYCHNNVVNNEIMVYEDMRIKVLVSNDTNLCFFAKRMRG